MSSEKDAEEWASQVESIGHERWLLFAKATSAGLDRNWRGSFVGWVRPGGSHYVVGRADSGGWFFVPEHLSAVDVRYYDTEEQALAAAFQWRDAVVLS